MPAVSPYAVAAILCLQTVSQCVVSTLGQYIYASFLQLYPNASNFTETVSDTLVRSLMSSAKCPASAVNSSDSNAQLWAQQQSADLFYRIDLWKSFPMVVMTYLLGIYTPTLGRRLVFVIPMCGTGLQLFLWLAIIYLHSPDFWWCIASFVVGLSGSSAVLSEREFSSLRHSSRRS